MPRRKDLYTYNILYHPMGRPVEWPCWYIPHWTPINTISNLETHQSDSRLANYAVATKELTR